MAFLAVSCAPLQLDEFPVIEREIQNNSHFTGVVGSFGLSDLGFEFFDVEHKFPNVAINKQIEREINKLRYNKHGTRRMLEKFYLYKAIMGQILIEEGGLDPFFTSMAWQESTFVHDIQSRDRYGNPIATGYWQFIDSIPPKSMVWALTISLMKGMTSLRRLRERSLIFTQVIASLGIGF